MSKRMSRYPTDRKVYVGDLGNNARKNELEYIFSEYGTLRSVWIARNPPGFAFVEYEDARDAADAVRGLDGRTICGRRVRVELSTGKYTNGRLERNGSSRNRGKGFHPGGKCYECGGRGHYARDCRRHGRYRRSPSRSRSRSYSRDHRTRSRTGSQSRSYSRSRSRNASVKRDSRDVRHRSKSRENDRRSRSIGNGSATNEHHHTSSGAVGGSGNNGDKRSSLKHHHHHHHHHRRNVSSPKRSTHSNTPRRSSHERSKSSRSFSNSRRVRSYSRSSSHSRSHSKEKNNRD